MKRRVFSIVLAAVMLVSLMPAMVFAETEYDITININDPSLGTAGADRSSAAAGEEVSLHAEPKEGCRFVRWRLEAAEGSAGTGITFSGNKFTMPASYIVIEAVFEAIPVPEKAYHVTVTVNDPAMGTAWAEPSAADEGDVVVLKAEENTGYCFKGWQVEAAEGPLLHISDDSFTMPASDVKIRAIFEAEPGHLTPISDAAVSAENTPTYRGESVDPDDFGITVTLGGSPLNTAAYELRFYTDPDCTAMVQDAGGNPCTPTNAGVYYVRAEGIETNGYTGTTSAFPVKINKAALGKPQAVSGPITYDGTEKTGVQLPDGADPSLYTITGGSAADPGSYLATVALADPANYCWTGESADPEAIGTSQPFDIPWTVEEQILPPVNYVVRFDMNGHGTTPAAITAASGSVIAAPAAPTASGYTFGGWYKDAACGQEWNFTADVVTKDMTLYAKWTENAPGPGPTPTPTPDSTPWSDLNSCFNDSAEYGGTAFTLTRNADDDITVVLNEDITAEDSDEALTIPSGMKVAIDLNGHTLDRGLGSKEAETGGNVLVAEGVLTVTDSSASQSGRITGGNTTGSGGGVFVYASALFIMTGGSITGNHADENGGGVFLSETGCLAGGTMITMADGSRKTVENLQVGDDVRTFDHETGQVSHAKIFDYWQYALPMSGAFTLHFSDGIDVTAVTGHCFFDRAANAYVTVNTGNANEYIGHEFYCLDDMSWKTLEGVTFLSGSADAFIVVTEKHMNCSANGMLSNEDGIYCVPQKCFAFDENMKIDAAKKAADIARWGLWTYEDVHYITEAAFDAFNIRYMSVAIGKGLITREMLEMIGAYSATFDTDMIRPEVIVNDPIKPAANVSAGSSGLFASAGEFMPLLSASGKPVLLAEAEPPAPVPGIVLGGNAVITGNTAGDEKKENNLYLQIGQTVTIGEGTNVPVSMSVGVTAATEPAIDAPVAVTVNAARSDVRYFFADDENQHIEYAAATSDPEVPAHLELVLGKDLAAKIGDTEYAALADAVAAVQTGQTIDLCKDTNGEAITVERNAAFTVAYNGYFYDAMIIGDEGSHIYFESDDSTYTEYNISDYSIRVSAEAGGTVSDDSVHVWYISNTTCSITADPQDAGKSVLEYYCDLNVSHRFATAAPDEGYEFDHWSYSIGGTDQGRLEDGSSILTAQNTGNLEFVAHFKEKTSPAPGPTPTPGPTPPDDPEPTPPGGDDPDPTPTPTPSYDPDPVAPTPAEEKNDAENCAKDGNCPIAKFADLDTARWYHNGIHYCLDHGIMSGKTETEFAPNDIITRGEIAAMLWRLEGRPAVDYFMQFKDVAAGKYYSEAIRWTAAEKIAEGYSAESFGVSDAITREQLAVILYRYAQKKGEGFTDDWMFLLPFEDRVKISGYAEEAVHWCYMKGIIAGKNGNVFDPQGRATRAEAACMIQRFCERNEGK